MFEGLILSIALTHHVNTSKHYNDVHPMISYRHEDYSVGVYHNSIDKASYFVSKYYKMTDTLDIQYGLVSGYNEQLVPMLIVRKQLSTNFNAVVMPGIEIDGSRKTPILVFGIEFKLQK